MKSNIEKTTQMPKWKVGENHRIEYPTPGGGCVVVVGEYKIGDYNHRNLIVQAVNQYVALKAVAEAAQIFIESKGIDGHVSLCPCKGCILKKALAALQSTEKEGKS